VAGKGEAEYRLLAFETASPYVGEYRGTRERDEGTLSPEETVSVGG